MTCTLTNTQPLKVTLADDRAVWNEYVRSHENASIYHRYAWREVIEDIFGHSCPYLIATRGQQVVGLLPAVQLKSRLFGNYLVSMPYVTGGGVLADDASVAAALLVECAQLARRRGCSHIETRDFQPLPVPWHARTDKVVMRLPLSTSIDGLSKQIGKKLRAQVKRPLREGATAHRGGQELVGEFYTVFAANMRDLGTPVYGRALFDRIAQTFPEECEFHIIRIANKPVAAGLLLRDGERMEIPWASSLRRYGRISVNMLLYWEALRACVEHGVREFDFGRSTRDSGTYRFKRQWGAEPTQLFIHYWMREGEALPALTPDNPKYALAIAAWQQLPVWVTNRLGPPLVKYLP